MVGGVMNSHQQKCAAGIFTGIFLSHPVSVTTKNAINWHIFTILKRNYMFSAEEFGEF